MELTISQIGSALTHWVPRPQPVASDAVRLPQPAVVVTPVVAAPSAGWRERETEYDQFGRFGAGSAPPVEQTAQRPAVNASKTFRSGNATPLELEREYALSIVGSYTDPGGFDVERHFMPFGMTEYQVYQLQDYQYRWMIQLERQAALDKLLAEI